MFGAPKRFGRLTVACLTCLALVVASPSGDSPATEARHRSDWRAGPGLRADFIRLPGRDGKALRVRGRAFRSTLAHLTIFRMMWPPGNAFSLRVPLLSPDANSASTCVRLRLTAVGRRHRHTNYLIGPVACLKPGVWQWLGLRFAIPPNTTAVLVSITRARGYTGRVGLVVGRPVFQAASFTTAKAPAPAAPEPAAPKPVAAPPKPAGVPTVAAPAAPLSSATANLGGARFVFSLKSSLKGRHPRLFLTDAALARYRDLARGELSWLYKPVIALARRDLDRTPPHPPFPGADDADPWRGYGNKLPVLAFAFRMTGDKKYAVAAKRWALTVASWPDWGSGEFANNDLAAAHLLYGLAVAYDWLYPVLSEAERRIIRRKLVRQGRLMHRASTKTHASWWNRSWRQNHLWVNNAMLGVAGLVLLGEAPEARAWVVTALGAFNRVFEAMPEDGSHHEGIPYWGYGVGGLALFFSALENVTGASPWPRAPWLRKTLRFRLHCMLPNGGGVVNFGDAPEAEWGGPAHIYALARAYRSRLGQWLGRVVDYYTRKSDFDSGLWSFLFYDPTLKPEPPKLEPTFALFPDLDLLTCRGSWTPNATFLAFKCGSPGGKKAVRDMIRGIDVNQGHSHPDQNSFILFAGGRMLVADDGYPAAKSTAGHNTLLINGQGQRGDGLKVYYDPKPRRSIRVGLRRVLATPFVVAAVGEAAAAYPAKLGLKSYRRTVIFLPPDLVVIHDHVTADKGIKPAHLFHFRGPLVRVKGQNRFKLLGPKRRTLMTARFLSPRKLTSQTTAETRTVFGLFDARVTTKKMIHTTLSIGPAGQVTDYHFLGLFKTSNGGRQITDLGKLATPDAFGAAFTESKRRSVILVRRGRVSPGFGRLRVDARLAFFSGDREGRMVYVGLDCKRVDLGRRRLVDADRPMDLAIMRRPRAMVVMAWVRAATTVSFSPGFEVGRVLVDTRAVKLGPVWKRGRVRLTLSPGRRVIVIVGPKAPKLPPMLSAGLIGRFFLAK